MFGTIDYRHWPSFRHGRNEAVYCTDLRPILFTPVLSKPLEFFIGSKVWDCISNSIDVSQYGAQKVTCTTHALVDMILKWITVTECKETVRILLVDFSKAYNHVCHNVLVKKLTKCNVPDILVHWICAFLQDRKTVLKSATTSRIGCTRTDRFCKEHGLVQWHSLSLLVISYHHVGFTNLLIMPLFLNRSFHTFKGENFYVPNYSTYSCNEINVLSYLVKMIMTLVNLFCTLL